jgi:hypothetical protein
MQASRCGVLAIMTIQVVESQTILFSRRACSAQAKAE